MPAEISETDLLDRIQAITAMPEIDAARVAAVIKKMRNNQLDILGSDAELMACAERIAKQIIDDNDRSS